MTELDDYLENETIGIPMLVTNKIFDKIYAKENRNKFIASLILFI
nr:hypothetical protein [Saccharolobus solfataricus]